MMSSMKGLVEPECGGQNALMKLAGHFSAQNADPKLLTQDNIRLNNVAAAAAANPAAAAASAFVNEYLGESPAAAAPQRLAAPRTFHMGALLNEIKQMDHIHHHQGQAVVTSGDSADWAQDYLLAAAAAAAATFSKPGAAPAKQPQQQQQQMNPAAMFKWSSEYLAQTETTIFDEAWENLLMKSNSGTANAPLLGALGQQQQPALQQQSSAVENQKLDDDMRKTANELLDSLQDSRFSESEFLKLVKDMSSNGSAALTTDANKELDAAFLDEYQQHLSASAATASTVPSSTGTGDLASDWAREFQVTTSSADQAATAGNNLDQFWDQFQNEWNTLAANNTQPWLDEFQKVMDTYRVYEFDKENPLQAHPDPFKEGLERLKAHDIVNAVLLFEAAVQKEPENALAWQYLGTTQVENEMDTQAIRALRRSLDLKGDNLVALSTLATSYTNESMQRLAFESLIKWLQVNPKYAHLLTNDEQGARLLASVGNTASNNAMMSSTLGVVHVRDFMDLQEIYLKAVRVQPQTDIDPDVQCNLGVLFHLSSEYDKAADCFRTALQIRPNDHLLWNKLGATYANSNRNEDAIDAYYQALKLCPGFVRARYNLGIGCMNLGAYKESVEHFLTALVQQSQANISSTNDGEEGETARPKRNNVQQMSETIWSTLRLALSYLSRSDLYTACTNRDLDFLRKEFKI